MRRVVSVISAGREPWSSGSKRRLISEGCEFESQHQILDGHFFALICCKIWIVCLKRPKINEKDAEAVPLLQNKFSASVATPMPTPTPTRTTQRFSHSCYSKIPKSICVGAKVGGFILPPSKVFCSSAL